MCNIQTIYDFRFTYIDVGAQGRVSDGGVYDACSLKAAMERNSLGVPSARKPDNSEHELPYVIVADEAFPLKTHLLKPYSRRQLNYERRVNYFKEFMNRQILVSIS